MFSEPASNCSKGPHRDPQGPNEDTSVCYSCGNLTWGFRPEDEQFGLHLDDCSLPQRHEGYCVEGGAGHAPVKTIRGWWPGFDEDVAEARERFSTNSQ